MLAVTPGMSMTVLALTLSAVMAWAGLLSGCASEKPVPAAATPPPPKPASLAQIKSEILQAKTQLAMTTESLNKLHKSSAADAQANYNAFTEQFLKLQANSEAVAARSQDLKKRASDYYAMWNRQVEVENPDLRRQAVQQKTDAERLYNGITSDMELARLTFQPYVSNLKDVGSYLKGNVTPATLASISDLVQKANAQSKEVEARVASIVASIDRIASATGEATAPGAAETGTSAAGSAR